MKQVNILKLLYEKKITEKEAYKIYDDVMKYDNSQWIELLGLTRYEAAAYSFGFQTIARWRYKGWPTKCTLCKKKLVIEKYGWMNKKVGNRRKLAHIDCSEDYLRMLGYTSVEMGYANDTKIKKITKNEMKKLKEKFKFVLWNQLENVIKK